MYGAELCGGICCQRSACHMTNMSGRSACACFQLQRWRHGGGRCSGERLAYNAKLHGNVLPRRPTSRDDPDILRPGARRKNGPLVKLHCRQSPCCRPLGTTPSCRPTSVSHSCKSPTPLAVYVCPLIQTYVSLNPKWLGVKKNKDAIGDKSTRTCIPLA